MMKICLSFDNGPDPIITQEVLDVLRQYHILSTFFVVGQNLINSAAYSVCKLAHDQGHWIGNHTFTHSIPLGHQRTLGIHLIEIARTQELIGNLAHNDKLFRPFGGGGNLDKGLLNRECYDYLLKENYTCVLWNCVPRDWEDRLNWPVTARAQCAERDWSLVVLHDLPTGAMDQLEIFIRMSLDYGATFTQEFPPDCIPLHRGRLMQSMENYVS